MTFWYGSGSGDPYLWQTDPDPAFFVRGWLDAIKKEVFFSRSFCFLLFEGTFTSVFKDKKQKKKSQIVHRNQGFSYFLGSGSGSVQKMAGIREAQTHTDPDPKHWRKVFLLISWDMVSWMLAFFLDTNSSGLKSHRKIHDPAERVYACRYCLKCFNQVFLQFNLIFINITVPWP